MNYYGKIDGGGGRDRGGREKGSLMGDKSWVGEGDKWGNEGGWGCGVCCGGYGGKEWVGKG